MLHRRKKKEEESGAPKWMVTYSDMVTLILVFFILLFSMSQVDAQKFRLITESFQQRQIFDFLSSAIPFEYPEVGEEGDGDGGLEGFDEQIDIEEFVPQDDMDVLLLEIQRYLELHELTDVISATRDDRGVVLVLQERTLFETGEAELLPEAIPFLNKVGTLLEAIPNIVRVEGHTDSRPISTYRYPSNWELSGARASVVIRYLIDTFDLEPDRFISVGYGETRPVAPNTTEENMRQNRRVIIVVADPSYDGETVY